MDYYRVLGIGRDAKAEDIKHAFRKLALKFHPDRHVNVSDTAREAAVQRFREVSQAYEVLSNERKRAAYDRDGRMPGASYERPGASRRGGYYRRPQGYDSYRGAQASSHKHRERSGSGSGAGNFRWQAPHAASSRFLNALFIGVALPLFLFADTFGDVVWKKKNSGKSFEEAIEAVKCARDDKEASRSNGSSPHPKGGNSREEVKRGLGSLESHNEMVQRHPEISDPCREAAWLGKHLIIDNKLSTMRLCELQLWLQERRRMVEKEQRRGTHT